MSQIESSRRKSRKNIINIILVLHVNCFHRKITEFRFIKQQKVYIYFLEMISCELNYFVRLRWMWLNYYNVVFRINNFLHAKIYIIGPQLRIGFKFFQSVH